ncbi:MAG: tetratricopeptide repeat protein, partial [Candidatus Bipolaricaulia bacterium]
NKTGNTKVAGMATERTRDEFLAKASKALQGENPSAEQISTAIEALDKMREYVEPNAESLYYRSRAHLKAGRYEQAIQTARRGLDMHQGSRSDAAKYYFVIAESQKQLGNKAEACETYKNATYGDYKARAEHYLKNECQ